MAEKLERTPTVREAFEGIRNTARKQKINF